MVEYGWPHDDFDTDMLTEAAQRMLYSLQASPLRPALVGTDNESHTLPTE